MFVPVLPRRGGESDDDMRKYAEPFGVSEEGKIIDERHSLKISLRDVADVEPWLYEALQAVSHEDAFYGTAGLRAENQTIRGFETKIQADCDIAVGVGYDEAMDSRRHFDSEAKKAWETAETLDRRKQAPNRPCNSLAGDCATVLHSDVMTFSAADDENFSRLSRRACDNGRETSNAVTERRKAVVFPQQCLTQQSFWSPVRIPFKASSSVWMMSLLLLFAELVTFIPTAAGASVPALAFNDTQPVIVRDSFNETDKRLPDLPVNTPSVLNIPEKLSGTLDGKKSPGNVVAAPVVAADADKVLGKDEKPSSVIPKPNKKSSINETLMEAGMDLPEVANQPVVGSDQKTAVKIVTTSASTTTTGPTTTSTATTQNTTTKSTTTSTATTSSTTKLPLAGDDDNGGLDDLQLNKPGGNPDDDGNPEEPESKDDEEFGLKSGQENRKDPVVDIGNGGNLPHNRVKPERSDGEDHAFGYFVVVLVGCVGLVILWRKRQRILAYVIEGRRQGRRRTTSRTAGAAVQYRKLSTGDEE